MSTSTKPLRLVPSSILSIIGGSLMIISGLVPLAMLGMSGRYGMMGPGMMGPGMMMPLQPCHCNRHWGNSDNWWIFNL